MANHERPEPPVHVPGAAPALAGDAGFETRWDAWIARGLVHEQRARRNFVILASVAVTVAAVAYAVLR